MENDEKQSEDLPKYRLRATAMKTLLANAHQEGFSDQSSKLFSLLISNNEARDSVFAFCQTPHHLPLVSNIMNLLYDYYSKEKSVSQSVSKSIEIFQYLNDLINKQLPSSFISRVDINSLLLIDSTSHLASLFPSGIAQCLSSIPANQHQIAFLLSTLSYCDDISDYIPQIQPLISPKTSFSTLTFSELKLLSKHEEIENVPTVKTLISFCKSLPENEIYTYALPTILSLIGNRLQPQYLKEIPAFITYLIKKAKKDVEHLPYLCSFIDKVLEFPDSLNLLRPLDDDLVTFFITNAQLNDVEINDEIKDPTICGNKFIIKTFLNFIFKYDIDPFDCLMQTRDTSIGTMILAYSSADAINLSKEEDKNYNNNEDENININIELNSTSSILNINDEDNNAENKIEEKDKKSGKSKKNYRKIKKFDLDVIESFLNPLISQIKQSFSPSYQYLIRLCGICANKFSSKASLRFLVLAISLGSNIAYDYLINGQIPFDSIFPEIVNNFKPGRIDALYIQALQVLLQANQSSESKIPVLNINDGQSEISHDYDFDDPSCFAKLMYNQSDISGSSNKGINTEGNSEVQLSGSPTTETILFCNVVSSVLDFPEFLPLLGPSAATISSQFAIEFITHIQEFQGKGPFSQGVLSAYSNSIHSLDINVVYNLALTFLMILPGQSMLFLGISLQRLPPEIITGSLQKVIPYGHSNSSTFGKMIALIAHSYPDIALSFTEGFISSSATKRRVFFIFKTSETSEDTIVTIFYIIGYCSSFIESTTFIKDFFPFSTSFMSKYLVSTPKNQEVAKASLFSIQRMCGHIQKYQEKHDDFSFQSKDFLEDYVTSMLTCEVDKMVKQDKSNNDNENNNDSSCDLRYFASILLALASLVPLRPVRAVDKYQTLFQSVATLIQNTNDKSFKSILMGARNLYSRVIESNFLFETLVSISLSIFPSFLRNLKWVSICQMMNGIYEQYTPKVSSSNVIDNEKINKIIVNTLPLILTEECDQLASQIIFDVIYLFDKFKNQKSDHNEIDFKSLNGEPLRKSLFNFLSKQLQFSTIYEIITILLETFKDEKLLGIHHKNIALCIKYLLEMKGINEHQCDPKIVFELISAIITEKKEVSTILFEAIEIISQKSLPSILSVLISQNSPLTKKNEIFDQIIHIIIKNKSSSKSLISYLADSIYNDNGDEASKKCVISFAMKTFPLLMDVINETEKETWSKLYIGIVKQTHSVDSPLFAALFKQQNQAVDIKKDLYYYANETVREHSSSLLLILSYFPEKVSPFIRKLALALALYCPSNSHSFLSYALKDIQSYDEGDFDILIKIFNTVSNNQWNDLSDKFVTLIINFIKKSDVNMNFDLASLVKNKNVQDKSNNDKDNTDSSDNNSNNDNDNNNISNKNNDCVLDDDVYSGKNFCLKIAVCFLKNVDERGKSIFWKMIITQANENIQKYARVFFVISFEVDIDIKSLIPIIPKLAVSCRTIKEVPMLLHRVYQQIVPENETQSVNESENVDDNDDIAMAVLKSKSLSQYKVEFLNKFVDMMIHGDSVSQCIACISSYINEIDEATANVIETLINQLPKVAESDQKQISLMLQKVLI